MAISLTVAILEHQVFKQRDARDALGIWNGRLGVTGDATGGSTKVNFLATAAQTGGRVYVCEAFDIASIQGLAGNAGGKWRLLTNFPPADRNGGLAGNSFGRTFTFDFNPGFTEPEGLIDGQWGGSPLVINRVLLFGPRQPGQTQVSILELEIDQNVDLSTWSFEAWGYYWDREVVQVPGGPRLPLLS